ncbi:MAG: hypothetical protein QOF00_751 [Pseudonocardiales bacterium]|jgi:hypothetical protein|nr:hypothetical protein [Pseudonocardiales bacterium]
MSSDPETLVATPEHERAEPLDNLEGAGALSSWADVHTALQDPDASRISFATLGAGLDSLGAIADPFSSLLSSAIGWAIEHVWFLHEPLDALAGDPKRIEAQAQTWRNVSRALSSAAGDLLGAVPAATVWSGAAGNGYRAAAGGYAGALDGVAVRAEELAALVLGTGAAVGTERALIRDLIADFLARLVEKALAALVSTSFTFGGSVAAFLLGVVVEAVILAQRIARRISRLLDALSDAGGTAGQLVDGMRSIVLEARTTAPYMQQRAREITEIANSVPIGEGVELGKQFSGRKLEEPPGPG